MYGYRLGSGYLGSSDILKSNANEEVIPMRPEGHTVPYSFYKFTFSNPNQPCRVRINGGAPIYIDTGNGVSIDYVDAPIWSFIILEPDIDYNWFAGHS